MARPDDEPGYPKVWLEERGEFGCGAYDEASGLYEWYEEAQLTLPRLVSTHWGLIEADFQQHYGIDLDDPHLLATKTWRWLRTRILGLLNADTRVQRKLTPPPKTPTKRR